jgi:DNA-directed RNA polymerase subunit omega
LIYPSADTIEDKVKSRYSLVILSAKRAKQIKEGAPILIETTSTNPLTIALEEIAAGKVTAVEIEAELVPQAAASTKTSKTSAAVLTTAPKNDHADELTMEEPGDDDAEGA